MTHDNFFPLARTSTFYSDPLFMMPSENVSFKPKHVYVVSQDTIYLKSSFTSLKHGSPAETILVNFHT